MSFAVSFRGDFGLLSRCSSCSAAAARFQLSLAPSSYARYRNLKSRQVSRKRLVACRATETETEPDGNDDEVKEMQGDGNLPASTRSSPVENGTPPNTEPKIVDQISKIDAILKAQNDLQPNTETKIVDQISKIDAVLKAQDNLQPNTEPKLVDQISKIDAVLKAQDDLQEGGDVEVTSGSPLPGVKPQQLDESMRISKEIIGILKEQVFAFDTFFVTSQEPYEGGVLFKGNLRGQAAKSYEKMCTRLKNKFGDQYKLFLLVNPEDDMPVAVVVPKITLQPDATAVPEWLAAGAFGLVTIFTLLLRNVPALQSDLFSVFDNINLLEGGLPGALVTTLVLGVHELGHILAANSTGVKLAVPYFVPSWQIGSFGAITRIKNIVSKREDLLKVAAAGPLAGFSFGLALFLLGFILPPSDGLGVVVDATVFHESFLAGGIAKLILGDALKEGTPISVNPLVIWAWAGLLINAINSIPAGEADGGRISFAIWGRKASTRITSASIALLGLSSLFNDVAFYWVVLIFILQRGPIAPLSEEISGPDNKYVALGILVLILGLLVCLPYPFPFTEEVVMDLSF